MRIKNDIGITLSFQSISTVIRKPFTKFGNYENK